MNKELKNMLCNMDKERLNLFAKAVVHMSLLVLKANGDIEEVIAGRDIWDFEIDDELLSASKLWFDEVKCNEPFKDIFSEFYEVEYQEKGRNINGFFATPPDISYLINSLNCSVESKAYEKDFDDFCCGAGVFALQNLSIQPFRNYYLNDKDSFMCAVTAMQILSNIATYRIYPKILHITNENALLNERIPFLTVRFMFQTIPVQKL
ncbi:hypothetical protein GHO45_03820 [Pseudomonas sp. FSL R10-0765]|uniref:hypothetical protein n=1 Tax=Pseudomonas sp. FSL R10-0765 TaxID=2662195 RepID=UPI0012976C87|nr:hypothetical protein [Pseudomonas sp. FSL R10-0765]MQT40061.1 hypothetical protein [Pseudomonas sp. FSL R10-0765]